MPQRDVTIVGSGPNGLAAAAIAVAHGLSVHVVECADSLGGGARTSALTLPGYLHDVCSHAHPMAMASPFFRAFDLPSRGVELRVPEVQYAQPLTDGSAAVAYQDLGRTVDALGTDGAGWRRLMQPIVDHWDDIVPLAMGDMRSLPSNPLPAVGFGLGVLSQASPWWSAPFAGGSDGHGAALLTGVAAHAIMRPRHFGPAAVGMLLAGLGHAVGWPLPVGGSQAITDALVAFISERGGTFETGVRVRSLGQLPRSRAVLLDVAPREAVRIVGADVSPRYRRAVERYVSGGAAAKVDFALSEPPPWRAAEVGLAGTVHVGGTRSEVVAAESAVAAGRHAEHPYVLLGQPWTVDGSRAPEGGVTLSAYAHVPVGSTLDMTEGITAEIERFAPGFRDTIVASHSYSAMGLEGYNPSIVGGDIGNGAATLRQLLARPVAQADPYATPVAGVFLCSAATAPGPGVHGMCGVHAMRRALHIRFGITGDPLAALRSAR